MADVEGSPNTPLLSHVWRALPLVVALGVGGIAWSMYARQDAAQRSLQQETAHLREQVAAAERSREGELPRAIAEGLRTLSPAAATPSAPLASPAATASAPRSARARSQEMASRLDQLVSTERTDPVWSSETARAAEATLATVTGSRLRSAECRTSLCRFVVSNDSLEAQHGLAEQIAGQGPFAEDVWYYYDRESNPPQTTLYVARHGVPLRTLLGDVPPRPLNGPTPPTNNGVDALR